MMRKFNISFILSFAFFIFSFLAAGQNTSDSNIINAMKTAPDSSKVNSLLVLTEKYLNINPDLAYKYAKQALSLSESINYIKGTANSLSYIGTILKSQGEYDTALINYQKALKYYTSLTDQKNMVDCLDNIGDVYQLKGDYTTALSYFNNSLSLSKKIGYNSHYANYYNFMGIISTNQGNYVQAMKYYHYALKVYEFYNDSAGMAGCYNNIGVLCDYSQNSKALDYYIKAMELNEHLGINNKVAYNCNNIGTLYLDLQDYEKASFYFNKALDISQELGNMLVISASNLNLGAVQYFQGNFDKSLEYAVKALKIRKELGDEKGICFILNNITGLLILKEDYATALSYADSALAISKKTGSLLDMQDAYFSLSEINDSLGNSDKAFEYFKLYAQVKDSLLNTESQKNIVDIEAKYQNEKKEKEINSLQNEKISNELELTKQKNLKNVFIFTGIVFLLAFSAFLILFYQKRKSNKKLTEINRKLIESEDKLSKLNNTKNQFFSIISHDLRGPLVSMRSSLNLYLGNHDSFTDSELQEFIRNILKSVDSVSNLFENLLNWSRSETGQISFRPIEFDLFDIIKETQQLLEIKLKQKQITLNSSVKPDTMIYADENMIKFVCRNLLDNAIKFTHPDGTVSVSSKMTENNIEVTVSDSGLGMSDEIIRSLFNFNKNISTSGTANEKGTGLGLMLCNEFIKRNGGTIFAKSSEGNGSEFTFTVPLAF